ncbi:hypothetical protein VP275E431_P0075 [Vibrio phage 275E43-1]|nr:hypothetical protein VP275E431_P0075 [Vibrio phage 275E43-1]
MLLTLQRLRFKTVSYITKPLCVPLSCPAQ